MDGENLFFSSLFNESQAWRTWLSMIPAWHSDAGQGGNQQIERQGNIYLPGLDG
jgi:hypothetical protein